MLGCLHLCISTLGLFASRQVVIVVVVTCAFLMVGLFARAYMTHLIIFMLPCKVFEPLVKVLRLADGDGPSMASMYGELISAKREIKVAVENSEKDYLVITNAMNTKMSGRLDSPLHMIAYILNPKYSYADPSIFTDVEVVVALMEVMETFYYDDDIKQNKVFNIDFTKFKKKEGMFGKVAALKAMDNNNFDAGKHVLKVKKNLL